MTITQDASNLNDAKYSDDASAESGTPSSQASSNFMKCPNSSANVYPAVNIHEIQEAGQMPHNCRVISQLPKRRSKVKKCQSSYEKECAFKCKSPKTPLPSKCMLPCQPAVSPDLRTLKSSRLKRDWSQICSYGKQNDQCTRHPKCRTAENMPLEVASIPTRIEVESDLSSVYHHDSLSAFSSDSDNSSVDPETTHDSRVSFTSKSSAQKESNIPETVMLYQDPEENNSGYRSSLESDFEGDFARFFNESDEDDSDSVEKPLLSKCELNLASAYSIWVAEQQSREYDSSAPVAYEELHINPSDYEILHESLSDFCTTNGPDESCDKLLQVVESANENSRSSDLEPLPLSLMSEVDSHEHMLGGKELSVKDARRMFQSMMRWRSLSKSMMDDCGARKKLSYVNTLGDVSQLISQSKKIVVITGAGISVSCGIPDFRSENGIYSMLGEYNLPCPQAMFEIEFFKSNPEPFFKFAKHLLPGNYQPSATHNFIKLLDSKGKLMRNYTQNIDGLEREAKINMENVHQCHGSLDTARCLNCEVQVPISNITEDIKMQKIPMCKICNDPKGIMKPNIVFFGENLGSRFSDLIQRDRLQCDLVLVMGSSLKVSPVSEIIAWMPKDIPLVLVNRETVGYPHCFDVELLGDSDEIVSSICSDLSWELERSIELKKSPSFEFPSTYYFTNGKKRRFAMNNFDSFFDLDGVTVPIRESDEVEDE